MFKIKNRTRPISKTPAVVPKIKATLIPYVGRPVQSTYTKAERKRKNDSTDYINKQ